MGYRTDLAIENIEIDKINLDNGVKHSSQKYGDMEVSTVEITNSVGASYVGKPEGSYITVTPSSLKDPTSNFEYEVGIISEHITSLFPHNLNSALVVGLGNSQITPDALGPASVNYIFVTRHIPKDIARKIGFDDLREVSAISPGVLGQTGIESAQIIKSVCAQIKPDLVIVVDALAAKSISRLGSTIQIANTGISPGSGVLNHRQELSRATLGVDVISIGVPMVVDLNNITQESANTTNETMMVTPREIDVIIEHSAKTVAYAINKAFHPTMSVEDIAAIVS